ncbi:MAG: DUF1330 domain-containing protein [Anderseniella sp.]|jgi:uncharacterized protein (DUF1330 family)|nr:DUF1330 domain-containing protein [Anderseniella sp.]
MAKGYWIAHGKVSDPDQYKLYAEAAPDVIAAHGGRFLARGGRHQQMEGAGKPRNVVIEFPSFEDAVNCWNSPGYQAARAKREGAGDVDIVIVEGV